jgi:hypothetical protein
MKKLVNCLGLLVAVMALGTLAGCELYFGPDHGNDWSYCGADGQYQCSGNDCHWVSSTCTSSGGSGGGGSIGTGSGSGGTTGSECSSNAQCATGCYCSSGVCTEGGFCTASSDCGPGYFCDTSRSSCEPGCTSNTDCAAGSVCDASTSQCTATCSCSTDADATAAGYGWCNNGTCDYGTDPNGSCGGSITCTQAQPTCPSGQVPTQSNGCWTGNCEAYAACDVAPGCSLINDETDCLGRSDCGATYTGLNCTTSTGGACKAGDSGCTCQSFVFASCASKTGMSRVFVNSSGQQVDASSYVH